MKNKTITLDDMDRYIERFAKEYPEVWEAHTRGEIETEAKRQGFTNDGSIASRGCVELAFLHFRELLPTPENEPDLHGLSSSTPPRLFRRRI